MADDSIRPDKVRPFTFAVPTGAGSVAALPDYDCRSIIIKSPLQLAGGQGNIADVMIGGTEGGEFYPLSPGEYLEMDVDNAKRFRAYSDTAGQILKCIISSR